MTVRTTRYNWCDNCDDRVELVPMAGGKAMACAQCDAIVVFVND